MAAFQATDDPLNGAPLALCTANDAFRLLAPASCVLRAGAGVPSYTFHRHDYHWLAISLSRCDEISSGDHSLDPVLFGTHVLSWDAMHQAVSTAVAAGFTVLLPSDASTAVKSALLWSVPNRTQLRALSAADFVLLPPIVPAPPLAWWLSVTYSSWVLDGSLHALSHAIGFSGPIWEPATRDADSRLHLSMLLTQEFCPISLALPVRLYGDPAVRYYVSSMPPPQFLLFPTTVSRLHGAWSSHHSMELPARQPLADRVSPRYSASNRPKGAALALSLSQPLAGFIVSNCSVPSHCGRAGTYAGVAPI